MKKLRCGEYTCIHHDNGCTAPTIQVRAYMDKPLCNTYEVSPVEVNTAQLHMMGEGNGYIGDGIPSEHPYHEEHAVPEKSAVGEIVCTVSKCRHNDDYCCSAKQVDIGMPKEQQIDAECKTFAVR